MKNNNKYLNFKVLNGMFVNTLFKKTEHEILFKYSTNRSINYFAQ